MEPTLLETVVTSAKLLTELHKTWGYWKANSSSKTLEVWYQNSGYLLRHTTDFTQRIRGRLKQLRDSEEKMDHNVFIVQTGRIMRSLNSLYGPTIRLLDGYGFNTGLFKAGDHREQLPATFAAFLKKRRKATECPIYLAIIEIDYKFIHVVNVKGDAEDSVANERKSKKQKLETFRGAVFDLAEAFDALYSHLLDAEKKLLETYQTRTSRLGEPGERRPGS